MRIRLFFIRPTGHFVYSVSFVVISPADAVRTTEHTKYTEELQAGP